MADTLPAVAVAPEAKAFWKSKTFWANVLAVVAIYTGYLPKETAAYVIPAVNILLRFLTVQPVTVN